MARELSETLEAQQKWGLITRPYVRARITKKWGGVIRYDFESLYSGEEDDSFHTAAIPSDGSLIRLRVTVPGDARKLYYQRVTSPTPESDFSAWTYLDLYNVYCVASCAYEAKVSQFYVNNLRTVYHRESVNSGANWGSWSSIGSTGSTSIYGMAAAYKPNGDLAVFICDASNLYFFRRVSAVWQSRQNWAETTGDLSGVGVYYDGDWMLAITGKDSLNKWTVWTLIYGDGGLVAAGSWGDLEVLIYRETTEPFEYYKPFIARPDHTRLYFVERHTLATETTHIWYSQMPPSATFDQNAWLEPVPMEPQSAYGLALTKHGSYAWLTNAQRVFRALATEDALDLTDRLLELDSRDYPDIFKGSLKVVIDNTGGWYDDFDRLGQQLEVGIGYVTGAGNEYSNVPFRWITKFKLVAPPWYPLRMIVPIGVIGTLKIETEDAWTFLYRYRTRRHLEWAAETKTVKELLQFFIARCGLDFDVISQSDAVQNFKPAFEVRTGTSYRTAIKNLLKMVPDQLVFREAKVLLRNPALAEAARYEYYITGDDNSSSAYGNYYPAQTFTPSEAHLIKSVRLKIGRQGSPGTVYVGIKATDGAGQPTGADLCSGTTDGDTLETSSPYGWRTITLGNGYNLAASIKYAIVVNIVGGSSSNRVIWQRDATSPTYAGGCIEFSINGGVDWTSYPDWDFMFEEWGDPPAGAGIDWTYHTQIGVALLVFRGEYGETAINPNRAEVWGDTLMVMDAKWSQVGKVRDRLSRVTSPTYPDVIRAGERVDAELRRSEILTGEESRIIAPTNCGLEPWDVLMITDANAGVVAIKRRVRRIKAYWNKRHWHYQQIISLGAE